MPLRSESSTLSIQPSSSRRSSASTWLSISELPWWNLIATAEFVWADSMKEIDYQDLNYSNGGLFRSTVARSSSASIRRQRRLLITTTSEGEATNFRVKLERPIAAAFGVMSPTPTATPIRINDGTSSRAVSNFQFNETLDPNNASLSTSDFRVEHRFNASLSYRFNSDGRWPTTLSGYYNHQSGRPYSYIYGRQFFPSINEEQYFSNDLLWVPANEGDVVLSRGTWPDLDRYINSEKCLSNNRGKIVPRNDCASPWNTTLDLRVAQDLPIRQTKIQLTFDILNFMNIFDDEAGSLWFANFNTLSPINIEGITDDGRPIYALDNTITDPENNEKYQLHTTKSRWRARVGIRWTF